MRLPIIPIRNVKDLAISARIKWLGGEIIELNVAINTPMFLETDCIMLLSYSVRDCSITV